MVPLRKYAKAKGAGRISFEYNKKGFKFAKIYISDTSIEDIPLTLKSYKANIRELGVTESYRSGRLIATLMNEENTREIVSSLKTTYIHPMDREDLGKMYFQKGVYFFNRYEFGKASEFFKEGLDFVTCDCPVGVWKNRLNEVFYILAEKHEESLIYNNDYLFSLAFLLSSEENNSLLNKGLNAINQYLKNEGEDEYGYYVKGRIFMNLKEFENSLVEFEYARSNWDSARLRYQIGRIKEHEFNENGIEDLFYAFHNNPSSVCCGRRLYKYLKRRFKHLKILSEGYENPLLRLFNDNYKYVINDYEYIFLVEYNKLSKRGKGENISNKNELYLIIDEFLTVIRYNLELPGIENKQNKKFKSPEKDNTERNQDKIIPAEEYNAGDVRYDDGVNPWVDVVGLGEEAEIAYWNTE